MRPTKDWSQILASSVDGLEVLHAHFSEHRFDRHSHETWSFGVTHRGRQTFRCRGTTSTSTPGNVIVFRPDDAHDGHAGDAEGFTYSMIYVPEALVQQWLHEDARRARGDFGRGLLDDPTAASALAQAALALGQSQESLRADAMLSSTIRTLFAKHANTVITDRSGETGDWLKLVQEYLESCFDSDVRVQDLMVIAGVTRVHLSRSFARRFGVPPHVYLNNVRLHQAKKMLRNGLSIAQVAAGAGFSDQSHFTRRFKGSFGVTPKAWLRAVTRS